MAWPNQRLSRSKTQVLSRLKLGITRDTLRRPVNGPLVSAASRAYDAALNDSLGVTLQPGVTNGSARLPKACARRPVTRWLSTAARLSGFAKRLNSPSKLASKPEPIRNVVRAPTCGTRSYGAARGASRLCSNCHFCTRA